jgi:hypothetical protein
MVVQPAKRITPIPDARNPARMVRFFFFDPRMAWNLNHCQLGQLRPVGGRLKSINAKMKFLSSAPFCWLSSGGHNI